MTSRVWIAAAACVLLAACAEAGATPQAGTPAAAPPAASAPALVERGRYLVTIMDCAGCHDTGALAGRPTSPGTLAGAAHGFEVGPAVVYAPNLTPHPQAGLGGWTDAQIATALRTGARPDGRELSPVMPWRSYAALTEPDMTALVAYLRSLPPSDHQSPGPATPETATAPYHTMRTPGAAS